MSDRREVIANIPVRGVGGVNNLRVTATYGPGGVNMYTRKEEPRGYSIHVQPEALEYRDIFVIRNYTPVQGLRQHCLTVKAFNAKAFERFCTGARELAQPLIDSIVFTHGLELATPTPTEE